MSADFANSSTITQLIAAFNAGLITSLSPCIYPLIPITLAIFGASVQPSRWRSFLLALSYVLGIATTYTALGIISAKTGSVFGSLLSIPWVIFVLSLLLCALALFSLDVIKFGAIAKIQDEASRIGGKGFRGAFLMGAVSGFVAAPCAGPMLVIILGIAAAQQNTLWGALLLFTYAIGMGTLFLLLGLFPELLRSLPRSGNWLHAVKFVTAVLLIMVALFLTQPYHVPFFSALVEQKSYLLVALLAAAAAGGYWGYKISSAPLKVVAAVLFSLGAFYLIVQSSSRQSDLAESLHWGANIETSLQTAKERSTLTMVDLFADWCAACKELEAKTFSDSKVGAALRQLELTRIDFTLENEETEKITDQYAVTGLPCILFLTADGREVPDSRITGFVEAPEFLAHLSIVRKKAESK